MEILEMASTKMAAAFGIITLAMCGTATAQEASSTVLSGVSPIPSDAQKRFCYYAGLAYSPDAYLPLAGSSKTVLLQCVKGGDKNTNEIYVWVVRSDVVATPR